MFRNPDGTRREKRFTVASLLVFLIGDVILVLLQAPLANFLVLLAGFAGFCVGDGLGYAAGLRKGIAIANEASQQVVEKIEKRRRQAPFN